MAEGGKKRRRGGPRRERRMAMALSHRIGRTRGRGLLIRARRHAWERDTHRTRLQLLSAILCLRPPSVKQPAPSTARPHSHPQRHPPSRPQRQPLGSTATITTTAWKHSDDNDRHKCGVSPNMLLLGRIVLVLGVLPLILAQDYYKVRASHPALRASDC